MDASQDIEFWNLATVCQKTGLSKSEIYRRQKDEPDFPKSRPYRNSTRVFWLSTDVRRWMVGQLSDVGSLIG